MKLLEKIGKGFKDIFAITLILDACKDSNFNEAVPHQRQNLKSNIIENFSF